MVNLSTDVVMGGAGLLVVIGIAIGFMVAAMFRINRNR
jgi:hypothetical protein